MRKYRKSFIFILVALLLMFSLIKSSVINIGILTDKENFTDYYWNIINFNSIISGFMFTLLGIIISTIDRKVMRRLITTTITDEIYINISLGVYAGIFSIVCSLFLIFIGECVANEVIMLIAYLILCSIIVTLLSFLKGVKDVVFILNKTREELASEGMSKERRQKVYDQL